VIFSWVIISVTRVQSALMLGILNSALSQLCTCIFSERLSYQYFIIISAVLNLWVLINPDCVFWIFCISSQTAMNEATVSEPLVTAPCMMGSSAQSVEQHKSRNTRTDSAASDSRCVEPREHRRPNRPGIIWATGSKLEAKDFLNKW